MTDKKLDPFSTGKRVFLCGNGGSAANAVHIANDLISVGVRAHALTADVATLTAIANDYSYGEVFSRQLKVLAEHGDLLVVLSGSGRSPNIIQAINAAVKIGMTTWAVFGAYNEDGQAIADIVTRAGDNMQAAEEYQLVWGHEIMRRLKDNLSQTAGIATIRSEKTAA